MLRRTALTESQVDGDCVSVLFVCTGNICRSPTAEGVFRILAERAGLGPRVQVDSAGLHDYHIGEPPDPRTRRAAQARGYDLSGQRARRVEPEDFQRFDLILAMDDGHERALRRMAPLGCRARVQRFLAWAPRAGRHAVPDPYYGGDRGFEEVLDLIEAGCSGLIDGLRRGRIDPADAS